MINGPRQCIVTTDKLKRLRDKLRQLETSDCPKDIHPTLWAAEKIGLRSMIDSLQEELDDYHKRNASILKRVRKLAFIFWLSLFGLLAWLYSLTVSLFMLLFLPFIPGFFFVLKREWKKTL